MLKKKNRGRGVTFTIVISVYLSLFFHPSPFLEGQYCRSSYPGKSTPRWRLACVMFSGESSRVGTCKGREGSVTGRK